MDRETLEIVRAFVAESLDSLDEQEGRIQDIADGTNRESIHSIFRLFHTIKGLSGFLNFSTINTVTHEFETMLDLVRNMAEIPDETIIDLIYEGFDVIRTLLHSVGDTLKDSGHETAVRNLVSRLQAAITQIKNGGGRSIPSAKVVAENITPKQVSIPVASTVVQEQSVFSDTDFFFTDDQLSQLQNTHNTAHIQSEKVHEEIVEKSGLGAVSNEMLKPYIAEALDLIGRVEDGCLVLEADPKNMSIIGDIFGAVHSLKGNSGFMGLAEIEDMSMDLENILDAVRSGSLDVYAGLISMILTNIDIIKNAVLALNTNDSSTQTQHIQSVSHNQQTHQEKVAATHAVSQSLPNSPSASKADTLVNTPKPELSKQVDNVTKEDLPVSVPPTTSPTTQGLAQRKDIRVDTEKLDKLFDLVGELITIETMVTSNPEVVALELQSFTRAAGMLNKITRELQEVTMSIRMTPLEGLFNKMKRLVRDVSMRFDKKINLAISGAETEMDKNVIEEISDPLMHILRNAIDHGVESRERRLAAGKSETGTIKLQARYEGNEILIIVEDDGGGLNRSKILDKAIQRGLLKVPPEKVTDREVFQIIFEPGFSTADKISDISGRGVGMDVVKRNIEKLQGSITVDSKEGLGTRFTLRIPLTLAIMEGMLVRVGEAVYALPILSIRESFRPHTDAITITMDGQEVVRVRDELFAVIRLHETYNIKPQTTLLEEGILVIVEARERKACLFVDEIIGQQQIVVKGLSDYVGNVQGVTGCMILSNGEIGLITDVDAVLSLHEGLHHELDLV